MSGWESSWDPELLEKENLTGAIVESNPVTDRMPKLGGDGRKKIYYLSLLVTFGVLVVHPIGQPQLEVRAQENQMKQSIKVRLLGKLTT